MGARGPATNQFCQGCQRWQPKPFEKVTLITGRKASRCKVCADKTRQLVKAVNERRS